MPEETAIDAPVGLERLAPGYNGAGEAVGILDTGVQADHPFFGGRVVDGACFTAAASPVIPTRHRPARCDDRLPAGARTRPDQPGSPSRRRARAPRVPNECLHGTHVAGIAAGGTGSTTGNGSGVAWGANIVAVQVFTTLTTRGRLLRRTRSPCIGPATSTSWPASTGCWPARPPTTSWPPT